MSERVDFVFRLLDRMSGPAGHIKSTLGAMQRALGPTSRLANATGSAFRDAGSAIAAVGPRILSGVGAIGGATLQAGAAVARFTAGFAANAISAGAGGLVTLGRSMVQVSSQAQDTRFALASMMNAAGQGSDWTDSMGQAGDLMQRIERSAAVLPGETEDYVSIMQSAYLPLRNAGVSSNEALAQFVGQFGAIGATLQVGAQELGGGLARALGANGQLDQESPLWTRMGGDIRAASTAMHLHVQSVSEFNNLPLAQRLEVLRGVVGRYSTAVGHSGETWSAQVGTFNSTWRLLLRTAGAPLFERLTRDLGLVNTQMGAQTGVAERLGQTLAQVYDGATAAVRRFVAAHPELVAAARGQVGIGSVLSGHASHALANPRNQMLLAGAAGAAGLALGIPGLGLLVGTAMAVANNQQAMNAITSQGLPILNGLFQGVTQLELGLGQLVANALPGIFSLLDAAVPPLRQAIADVQPWLGRLGTALSSLANSLGPVVGPIISRFGVVMTDVVLVLTVVAHGISGFVDLLVWSFRLLGELPIIGMIFHNTPAALLARLGAPGVQAPPAASAPVPTPGTTVGEAARANVNSNNRSVQVNQTFNGPTDASAVQAAAASGAASGDAAVEGPHGG